eukprot:TRINITY_DN4199_c0_g1_i1.p1 TRINITY_DN4199_c0_g1~~TRINITY_DN4199_c0_g1_i1.p1  ORF type:complete len:792 (+),score=136.59 TRINITY_DN4199_c0_g1_i1:81-2456(+)
MERLSSGGSPGSPQGNTETGGDNNPQFEICCAQSFCTECEDTAAVLVCVECDEEYCELCFQSLHRKGDRRRHTARPFKVAQKGVKRPLEQPEPLAAADDGEGRSTPPPPLPSDEGFIGPALPPGFQRRKHRALASPTAAPQPATASVGKSWVREYSTETGTGSSASGICMEGTDAERKHLARLQKRISVTPVRLNEGERALLQVLLGSLGVSQYTEKVDVVSYGGRAEVANRELSKMCHLMEGLAIAANGGSNSGGDGAGGGKLVGSDGFMGRGGSAGAASHYGKGAPAGANRRTFLQQAFEAGRRYKIMNPDKMRTEYGKMLAMLQDASHQQQRGYAVAGISSSLWCPMKTVATVLASYGDHSLLQDVDVVRATRTIVPWHSDGGDALEREMRAKAEARARVVARHTQVRGVCVSQAGAEATRHASNGHHHSHHHHPHEHSHTAQHPDRPLSVETVESLLDSIGDADAYCMLNARPVMRMIQLLQERFDPAFVFQKGAPLPHGDFFSTLTIKHLIGGSRLSHSHVDQWHYVLQSLCLWLQIIEHMLDFWSAAEADMLKGSAPSLRNTGQGLHRVQGAERVGALMQQCIRRVSGSRYPVLGTFRGHLVAPDSLSPEQDPKRPVLSPAFNGAAAQAPTVDRNGAHSKLPKPQWQTTAAHWRGSQVVHLGDFCVPNALVFIDKYAQVPRILAPIVAVIDYLEGLKNAATADGRALEYVNRIFKGPDRAQQRILADFFRHAFDGSGADNNNDAGSCIDGRLTSCWNWCSKLEKKSYHRLFMLSGFVGFDGDFSR